MKMPFSGASPGKRIRRNALWNIFGQGLPLLAAVFCIPLLITGVGKDRFGALTLVWTVLAYFSLFDLGLGRALTQLLAKSTHNDKREESELVWMVSALMTGLGVVAGTLLFFLAPLLASRLLRLQGGLEAEMILSLRLLAVALPFLIQGLALRGILEAKGRFDLSNLIRIPLGIFTYGAPLLALPFSRSLSVIVAVLLAGRLFAWGFNFWIVLRLLPHLKRLPDWRPQRLRELLRFGGWVTVSSAVAPLTDNLDRFFIGSFLSISMVAYYTTPYELVTKLWVISLGIGGAMFPEFAARFHRSHREAEILYMRGFKYLLAALFPFVLVITAYAREGLTVWLDPSFADKGAPVLQWLALAMLIGGVAHVSFTLMLGVGKPHLPAWYDIVQLPLHAAVLYFLLKFYGLRGAAIAYALRNTVGFAFFLACSGSILKFRAAAYAKVLVPIGLAVLVILGFHTTIPPWPKAVLFAAALGAYAWLAWVHVLEEKDKAAIRAKLRRA